MLFLIAGFIGIIFIGMLLPVLSMSESHQITNQHLTNHENPNSKSET